MRKAVPITGKDNPVSVRTGAQRYLTDESKYGGQQQRRHDQRSFSQPALSRLTPIAPALYKTMSCVNIDRVESSRPFTVASRSLDSW